MRYYNFSLNANSEKIKSNAIIRLNDYDYDSITDILNEITSYKNEMLDIDEISTYQYIDDLIEANRLSSRRIEIIKDIDAMMYRNNDNLENLISGNRGGVLFIDEAYALISPNSIATLIQEMENNRENVIVILAGYSECMQDFLERNEGLKSRIPYWVDFPDYSADELVDILKLVILKNQKKARTLAFRWALEHARVSIF